MPTGAGGANGGSMLARSCDCCGLGSSTFAVIQPLSAIELNVVHGLKPYVDAPYPLHHSHPQSAAISLLVAGQRSAGIP